MDDKRSMRQILDHTGFSASHYYPTSETSIESKHSMNAVTAQSLRCVTPCHLFSLRINQAKAQTQQQITSDDSAKIVTGIPLGRRMLISDGLLIFLNCSLTEVGQGRFDARRTLL